MGAGSCRQSDVRGHCPVAVQTEAHTNGNVDGGDRALGDLERVEQQQVAAILVQTVADLHDPAIALGRGLAARSEEHTSELQSLAYLVCRLLLEKKKEMSLNIIRWPIIPIEINR